jgi:hypothetical protein
MRISDTARSRDTCCLGPVEMFVSVLTRRLLRRGEFTSRQDLIDQITDFVIRHNITAHPLHLALRRPRRPHPPPRVRSSSVMPRASSCLGPSTLATTQSR